MDKRAKFADHDLSASLVKDLHHWAGQLGFQQLGISDIALDEHEAFLQDWLKAGLHGEMDYMARHGTKRARPDELVPGTMRVISVRMDYLPEEEQTPDHLLDDPGRAYVSRYALGRDYHKVLRARLQKLAKKIEDIIGPFGYRVFVDSAPVLEKALAEKAGLGWIGKHTNLINDRAGSWFFLGEIYTDLPLPVDTKAENHCGSCTRCIDVCPTRAIIAPYRLDARRCISYLTIELRGAIPLELRPLIGNRIYGCDDCQLVCPWNRFAQFSDEQDFRPRHDLDSTTLLALFAWSEDDFLQFTEGSAIRRIGFECWQRNLAVAMGNVLASRSAHDHALNSDIISALRARREHSSTMVREHIDWALSQVD